MKQAKVVVPASVLEGLEAVRLSGKTNMLDAPMVAKLALDMGFPEAAMWIESNKSLYAQGIFRGFEPETDAEGGDQPCVDRWG